MTPAMRLLFRIWRQRDANTPGRLVDYPLDGLSPDMSFLEALDRLNEQLILAGGEPIEFDHDCREGICGQCGVMIDGTPHGPVAGLTTCQLHLREFADGATVVVEPFRARAFPLRRDLKVDRSAFDRIIAAGGYISVSTGRAPEANALPVSSAEAEAAFDSAACLGCGACVAACVNASAALFVGAKISHLALLPQGAKERGTRALRLVQAMDQEGFGHCSNTLECSAVCPQSIDVGNIARLNREYQRAWWKEH